MNSFFKPEELDLLGLANYGSNVLISRKASIYKPEQIRLGNNVRIEDFCVLSGPLIIGNFVHIAAGAILRPCPNYPIIFEDATGIAPRVTIFTTTDDYSGPYLFGPFFPEEFKNNRSGVVHLERFVLVGAQSIIMPKVTLKEGTSVGAMSFVTRTTKPWTIYFGIPARSIGERDQGVKTRFNEFLAERKGD